MTFCDDLQTRSAAGVHCEHQNPRGRAERDRLGLGPALRRVPVPLGRPAGRQHDDHHRRRAVFQHAYGLLVLAAGTLHLHRHHRRPSLRC